MISRYLNYIGLHIKKNKEKKKKEEIYKPSKDIKVAERYLEYLKELDHYQKERRATIENKNSQIVGQASIVASIFSLFVPLLIDAFSGITFFITIPLSIVFLIVLGHYVLTIWHAIKTLKINKYFYATRKTTTITKIKRAEDEIGFLNEEIADLILSVNQCSNTDSKKGDNLIYATRCFEIANFGFAILTVLIIAVTFALKKETPEIKVKNLNEINLTVPDTLNNRIIYFDKIDSFTVSVDSLSIEKNPAQ